MTFEWIPISLPQKFKVVDPSDFGIAADEVELSRDSDLSLRVSASAAGRCTEPEAAVAGTEWKASPIRLLSQAKHPCILNGYRRTNAVVTAQTRSQLEGRAGSLSISFGSGEAFAIVEWLTNAPDMNWTGLTERTEVVAVTRKREGDTTEASGNDIGSSWDHLDLHLNLPRVSMVRVGTVPAEFITEGLSVERPGFIEYRRGPEGLPDEQLRHAVRRALEFLFGSGLGVLGSSEVDQAGHALRAVTSSALVAGGFGGPLRPALLHEDERDGLDETLAADLVRRYVELERDYGLNRAVWLYLHGRNAPLEMKAGYVGAAFEILRSGYYERPDNEPRSRLLPPKRWSELATKLNATIEALTTLADWKECREELADLKSRLSGLNSVSGSRLNLLFLRDLGLAFGETEKRALQARNDAAHANEMDPSENFGRLRDYRSAHTLFARALLAILGVPVRYFDYSCDGFPVRELEQPQGGSP